jgi:hypothetical protein
MDKKASLIITFISILAALTLLNLIYLKISLCLIGSTRLNDIASKSNKINFTNIIQNTTDNGIKLEKVNLIQSQPDIVKEKGSISLNKIETLVDYIIYNNTVMTTPSDNTNIPHIFPDNFSQQVIQPLPLEK